MMTARLSTPSKLKRLSVAREVVGEALTRLAKHTAPAMLVMLMSARQGKATVIISGVVKTSDNAVDGAAPSTVIGFRFGARSA
jgi:hypothetical protein